MNQSVSKTVHRVFEQELTSLLDTVLAGEVVTDRATAERLVRTLGALVRLHGQHPVDSHGRCALCRPPRRWWWWPWRRQFPCSVHVALSFFLRQTSDSVLAALTEPQQRP